ncbi:uncharacterized protein LOC120012492 [Tripterygium wilfordii]|uniref:uncharacterized protein LOC120012492 n=1 Tax=Tripterygium wilfordii TaxID=458696 RepID=UPI0018F861E4|nr:uncharacterized protein LOC120012492 [Tripterygium wilfordii]
MNKKITALQGMSPMEGVWDSMLTPLAPEILEAEMPHHLVVPKLEKYEGFTDPCDHIQARTWFNQLPRHSITSFGDLSEKLALHFSAARRTAKTSLDLMNLDHEPGESLRSFLARFNRACLEIPYVQVEVAISALVRMVRDEVYVSSLTKKRPKSSSALGKTKKDLPPPNKKQGRVEGKSDKRKDDQSNRKTDQGPIPRYSCYTPLNSSLHNILLEDHGHDTEECKHLKDKIEGFIRRGYLKQFTSDKEEKRRRANSDDRDDDRWRQRRRDRSPRHQREIVGTIGVIVGGLATGGESSSARRAYARINEDPHDDALVVEAVIANFTVKKVLVDNGSAADILLYHAFREMKISEDKLKSFSVPLYGFAGESIIPKGVISLPVTLGTYPRTVMHMIDLLVMPGISREVISHSLSIIPGTKPVKQKKRNFAIERQIAIKEEVGKLLEAGFIREV